MKKYLKYLLLIFLVLFMCHAHQVLARTYNHEQTIQIQPEKKIKKVGKKYYGYKDGKKIKNELTKIDGSYYFFNKKGIALTSQWKTIKNHKYYFGANGKAYTGVKKIKSIYYGFSKSGKLLRNAGYKKINKKHYYFDQKGRSLKGLYKVGSSYCFFNGDGTIVKSKLKKINGDLYYFKSNGAYATGLQKIKNSFYYFGKDGKALRSKWIIVDGKRYYVQSSGRCLKNKLVSTSDAKYYFSSNGFVYEGYKVFNAKKNPEYYYFDKKGRSCEGIYAIPAQDYARYFYGDGTIAKSEFKQYRNDLYFFTKAGILCKSEWYNIRSDLGLKEAKYISTEYSSGKVKQGFSKVARDGNIYTFYLDIDAQYGYRLGKQDCGELGTYYFEVLHGYQGYLRSGLISDHESSSMYICDPISKKMLFDGHYQLPGTDLIFDIHSDGTIDYQVENNEQDDHLTKFMKACFSQLFKQYGHLSIGKLKQMSLDEINDYSCSGYVLRMLYETFAPEDIFGTNHDIAYSMYLQRENDNGMIEIFSSEYDQNQLQVGDFVFVNKDDCYESVDDIGDPLLIDLDGNGRCDREHEKIMANDGSLLNLHVHHVGIYIGNGHYINALPNKGVVISPLPEPTEEEYISAYARLAFNEIEP